MIETTYRKAILINKTQLCITLPKSWCNANEIQKGLNLKVVEDGESLIINKTT